MSTVQVPAQLSWSKLPFLRLSPQMAGESLQYDVGGAVVEGVGVVFGGRVVGGTVVVGGRVVGGTVVVGRGVVAFPVMQHFLSSQPFAAHRIVSGDGFGWPRVQAKASQVLSQQVSSEHRSFAQAILSKPTLSMRPLLRQPKNVASEPQVVLGGRLQHSCSSQPVASGQRILSGLGSSSPPVHVKSSQVRFANGHDGLGQLIGSRR